MAASALPPGHPVRSWDDLVLFAGGNPDPESPSFTALLLALIQKADPGNRARLRLGFPREVMAFELWHAFASEMNMTAAELTELIEVPDADPRAPAPSPVPNLAAAHQDGCNEEDCHGC